MAVERTLSIIKPDAVAKNVIGKITSRFETDGLRGRRRADAPAVPRRGRGFSTPSIRERPFFKDLVDFINLRDR